MKWWTARWAKILILVVTGALGVYIIVYVDVVSRAKESYLQGEKYMEWHLRPDLKKDFFGRKYLSDKAKLDESLAKKQITEAEYKERLESLAFDRDVNLNESSLKYAYQYYKDTAELFTPPESKWARMARVKTSETLELWKQELREQKIPFEDTHFE